MWQVHVWDSGAWRDSGEGPFRAVGDAARFAEAECGAPWYVCRKGAPPWKWSANVPAREKILLWVRREFNARHVQQVYEGLVDVAAGNRPGNTFEREALRRILG